MTLFLIVSNVYNSVKAPAKRGFSYIEIWMVGVQIPILTGLTEYGVLLALKKYHQDEKNMAEETIIVQKSSWATKGQ